MRVAQFAVRSAHDAITSRLGEEFAGSEDGNRLVKEMKDNAELLEFDVAEVECEILQTVKDLEALVTALIRRVAAMEDELNLDK